jgi:GTPase SAR1 family protein
MSDVIAQVQGPSGNNDEMMDMVPAFEKKEEKQEEEIQYDFQFRIVLLGDAGVGKSSLLYKELRSSL